MVAGHGAIHGSSREKALVGFAHVLTEAPWTINADDIQRLHEAGLAPAAIEQAILVTAFFNYFPRVADGTGIDFDYESPLPRIVVDATREALPRIPMEDWNKAVDGSSLPAFSGAPQITDMLTPWRVLHLERNAPLETTTRRLLAGIVMEELCDAGALRQECEVRPRNEAEKQLVEFARKLTRTPWAMNADDVIALRSLGLSDEAILGAITLVAHQNALSRMHHALAAVDARARRAPT